MHDVVSKILDHQQCLRRFAPDTINVSASVTSSSSPPTGLLRETDVLRTLCFSRSAIRIALMICLVMQTPAKVAKLTSFSGSYCRIAFEKAYHTFLDHIIFICSRHVIISRFDFNNFLVFAHQGFFRL